MEVCVFQTIRVDSIKFYINMVTKINMSSDRGQLYENVHIF